MKICNFTFEEYIEKIKAFHGSVAPGMILSGIMVDLASKNLPDGEFFDVICETQHCMVDAVQLLTPCTIGNGWVKIVETGRFALIFYNKSSGKGVRISIDSDKLEKWSEIKSWFTHDKPKSMQNFELLMKQMTEAGYDIFRIENVQVKQEYISSGIKKEKIHAICPSCKEMFYKKEDDLCPACLGKRPYEK